MWISVGSVAGLRNAVNVIYSCGKHVQRVTRVVLKIDSPSVECVVPRISRFPALIQPFRIGRIRKLVVLERIAFPAAALINRTNAFADSVTITSIPSTIGTERRAAMNDQLGCGIIVNAVEPIKVDRRRIRILNRETFPLPRYPILRRVHYSEVTVRTGMFAGVENIGWMPIHVALVELGCIAVPWAKTASTAPRKLRRRILRTAISEIELIPPV